MSLPPVPAVGRSRGCLSSVRFSPSSGRLPVPRESQSLHGNPHTTRHQASSRPGESLHTRRFNWEAAVFSNILDGLGNVRSNGSTRNYWSAADLIGTSWPWRKLAAVGGGARDVFGVLRDSRDLTGIVPIGMNGGALL